MCCRSGWATELALLADMLQVIYHLPEGKREVRLQYEAIQRIGSCSGEPATADRLAVCVRRIRLNGDSRAVALDTSKIGARES
jgi:hypothetical protein